MKAIVIGGGVAGAASAIALRRIGAQVTVYEAYEDPAGQVGSFLSLAANGLRGLEVLGCLPEVQAAGFAVERQRMWSGRGKLLGDVPRNRRASDPLMSVTLRRGALVSALRSACLRTGAKIVTGERVDAAIIGYLRTEADLVVGADGIWSLTRRFLDPGAPEPRYAGMYTVCGTSDGAGARPGAFNMVFARAGAFIYLPAPDGSVWWSAQVAEPRQPDLAAVGLDDVRALFGGEAQAGPILRAARGPVSKTLNHVLGPVRRRQDGRVVVIGDAAHPVGAGQGASMAIEDAVVLARELHRCASVADGLASFDALRVKRVGKMAKAATANRDAKTAGPVAARLRELIMPVVFPRVYPRATGWLYDYDLGTLPAGERVAAGGRNAREVA
jgi:salicylate hydroxylase